MVTPSRCVQMCGGGLVVEVSLKVLEVRIMYHASIFPNYIAHITMLVWILQMDGMDRSSTLDSISTLVAQNQG